MCVGVCGHGPTLGTVADANFHDSIDASFNRDSPASGVVDRAADAHLGTWTTSRRSKTVSDTDAPRITPFRGR